MKKVLASLAAFSILFVSMPAFACGGDKSAKKKGDEPMMTTMADGEDAESTNADDKKADADDQKTEEAKTENSGEV